MLVLVTIRYTKSILSRCNFSDLEIEMFFARYDQDGNFVFTTTETNRILNDINHDRVDKPPALQSGAF